MKKLLSIAIILSLLTLFSPNLIVNGQETEDPPEEEVTENLKERLKESLEDAKQNLVTTPDPNAPKAYVGTVVDLIQTNIEIQTKDGTRYAKTNDETTIIRTPGNKEIDTEDVRIDDFIISMGYQENETTLLAKRIIVSQSVEPELQKTTGKGTISDLSQYTLTITTPLRDEIDLNYYNSTIVKTKETIEDLDFLEEGQEIVYTADIDDEEYDATIIMVINKELETTVEDLTENENTLE